MTLASTPNRYLANYICCCNSLKATLIQRIKPKFDAVIKVLISVCVSVQTDADSVRAAFITLSPLWLRWIWTEQDENRVITLFLFNFCGRWGWLRRWFEAGLWCPTAGVISWGLIMVGWWRIIWGVVKFEHFAQQTLAGWFRLIDVFSNSEKGTKTCSY